MISPPPLAQAAFVAGGAGCGPRSYKLPGSLAGGSGLRLPCGRLGPSRRQLRQRVDTMPLYASPSQGLGRGEMVF